MEEMSALLARRYSSITSHIIVTAYHGFMNFCSAYCIMLLSVVLKPVIGALSDNVHSLSRHGVIITTILCNEHFC